jgi:hypothetical protein
MKTSLRQEEEDVTREEDDDERQFRFGQSRRRFPKT